MEPGMCVAYQVQMVKSAAVGGTVGAEERIVEGPVIHGCAEEIDPASGAIGKGEPGDESGAVRGGDQRLEDAGLANVQVKPAARTLVGEKAQNTAHARKRTYEFGRSPALCLCGG